MKHVLIVENSTNSLQVNESKTTNKFLLSGIFTEFDVENRNRRFYTAENFIPCMNAMMEKKNKLGVLYGEFDHPDVFDIAGKNISHAIENMEHNESANRIDGTIAVLSTHWGKEARAIINDGFPLFVSSRAAGITEANGGVNLKELFTYDMVVDPGFASARVNINESIGYSSNDDVPYRIYEMNDNHVETLFQDRKNDSTVAIDMKHMQALLQDEVIKLEHKIMETIKGGTADTSEIINIQEKYDAVQTDLNSVTEYLKYLESKVSFLVKKNTELSSELNESVMYSNHLSNSIKSVKKAYDKIEERITVDEKMIEYVAENTSANILFAKDIATNLINLNEDVITGNKFTEYIAEELKATGDFANYIAEEVDVTQKFTENVANETHIAQKFTESVANETNITQKFAENTATHLNNTMGFAEYVAEQKLQDEVFLSYIAEKVDGIIDYNTKIVETLKSSTPVVEGKTNSIHNLESIVEHLGLNEESELLDTIEDDTIEDISNEDDTIEDISNEETTEITSDEDIIDEETTDIIDEETTDIIEDTIEEETDIETSVETQLLSALVKILGSDETGIVIEVTPEGQVKVQKSGTEEIEEYTTEQVSVINTENNLNETVSNVLAEIKKQKVLANQEPHFFNFLSEQQVADFKALDNESKDAIVLAMNESEYYGEGDVLNIIGNVLNNKAMSYEERLVSNIPGDLKDNWNTMTKEQKVSIVTESKYFALSTSNDIKNFWNTRPFAKALKSPEATMIKESRKASEELDNSKLSDDFVNAFLESYNRLM